MPYHSIWRYIGLANILASLKFSRDYFMTKSVEMFVAVFLVGVLLIAGLWTSYYTVGAESEGVVLRFEKFLKTVEPGLHFKLPFGIDAVTVLPTRRQLKLEFGFATPGYLTNPIQVSDNPDFQPTADDGQQFVLYSASVREDLAKIS
jgi:regulator of protease activity HflC (stomatin/prohibitin superfamily)